MRALASTGRTSRVLTAALTMLLALAALTACGGDDDEATPTPPDRSADRASDPRPNIVVIMTDDQTLESMRVLTETNRLLGEGGVTFADYVVSFPICCPSRATYFTGQYGHNNGVMGNVPPHGGYEKFADQDTAMPVALQEAGYRTVHIGKYLNGYKKPAAVVPPGWDDWQGSLDPSTYRYRDLTILSADGERHYPPDDGYQTDIFTDLAVEAIEREVRTGQPFFLDVAYLAPHDEVQPGAAEDGPGAPRPAEEDEGTLADEPLPDDPAFDEADVSDKPAPVRELTPLTDEEREEITRTYRARLETLQAVDRGVARIVAALEELGQLDRTVVVFTSDNGFMHGEHRIRHGKGQVYEPSIHVPLLMRGPGLPRGVTRRGMAANIDLAPTILDLAEATSLREVDGMSLLPLARADQDDDRGILIEMGGPMARTYAIRTQRYVYVERPDDERELYDLVEDPFQLNSRHDDPALADVEADLARRLAELIDCAGETCNA